MREKRLENREGRDLPKVMQSWFLPWDQTPGMPALSPLNHVNYCFKTRTPNLAPPEQKRLPPSWKEMPFLTRVKVSLKLVSPSFLIGSWDPPPSGVLPLLCKFWERGHSLRGQGSHNTMTESGKVRKALAGWLPLWGPLGPQGCVTAQFGDEGPHITPKASDPESSESA